ncbi:MAG: hypothetical protein JWO12_285 [Frankiales bacterium]|nr:hypothetical protein [Frankiales bacterium]
MSVLTPRVSGVLTGITPGMAPDAQEPIPVLTRRQFGLLLLIGAVLLAGTCVLVFGPARGARNDIGHVRDDLNVSRRGIFGTLDTGRKTLAEATAQLRLTEQSLEIQQQGLSVAAAAKQDTGAIRAQTQQALDTVREVLAALGPISDLKGQIETVVKGVQAGVSLARSALAVAQQTLATGQRALAVAVSSLQQLRASLAVQRQLLVVAQQTLKQVQEINRKFPGAPIFPTAAPTR